MKDFLKRLLSLTPYVIYSKQRRGVSLDADIRKLLPGQEQLMVFDVGANEGQTTLAFRAAFPDAVIHAFEPVSSTFRDLEKNVGALTNVACHKLAFGAAAGEVTLYLQRFSQTNSLLPALNKSAGESGIQENVRVMTIDEFCRKEGIGRIDVLKTDTEGFDIEVLRGASPLLEDGRVELIYSEVGLRPDDPRHTPLSAVLAFLEERGFYLFSLYEVPWAEWGPSKEYCNALFARRSPPR
jgi:FkbM family methyltransferase